MGATIIPFKDSEYKGEHPKPHPLDGALRVMCPHLLERYSASFVPCASSVSCD